MHRRRMVTYAALGIILLKVEDRWERPMLALLASLR
jgi:hypothetical protein